MIREATLLDLPEVLRMATLFTESIGIEPDKETITETLSMLIDSPQGALFVADGAFVAALAYPLFMNKRIIVVQELAWWVDPDTRSKGLGKKMLTALERWAMAIGADRVMMIALKDSPKHVDKFYKASGYRPLEKTYVKEM